MELVAPLKFSVSIGAIDNDIQNLNNQQPAVEINAPLPEPPGATISADEIQATTDEHEHLLAPRAINLNICYRCHQNMLGWTSHPVDVVAPAGMIIPAEYPLLSGGLMSCMTCHTVHSSDREDRLLKDSKRELCIGCHTNY
ncbi:MAG: cytochrome c3 family protein [Desulfuromonas sp.]|nr:cytochrome c3 family protein [Desulfuromonas sp.]